MGPYFRRWHRESRPCWEPGATPVLGRGLEGEGVGCKGAPSTQRCCSESWGGGEGGSCGSPTVQLWDRSQCHPDRRCSPPPSPPPPPPQYRDPAVPRCGSDPRSQLCAGGVVTPGSSRAQMWRRSRDPAVCLASRRRCDPAVPRCGSDAPPPRIQLCAAVMATLGSSCAQL